MTSLRLAVDKDSRAIALALLLLLAALVMPRVDLPHDAYDYLLVFDISQSMNVEDYQLEGAPVSRLTVAHEAARRALRDLPCGSRVGWAAFTGYRTIPLLAPVEVCEYYNDLLASLEQIDARMRWSNASEITKGVYWSVLAAQETHLPPDLHPDIVFISDGQEAPLLDPAYPPRVLDDLQKDSIRGWLIGVGTTAPSPIPRIDEEGHRQGYWRADEVIQPSAFGDTGSPAIEHLSGLHEPHLRALADQLGFSYARLTGPASLSETLRDRRFARRRPTPTDLFWVPAAIAVLFLVVRFRPERR
ncbi:vWA domain-containing protein [Steroidobacter sp.]|uniref:vWA domain-containing protein n=1 Tax=Steroidobacter sp. TaxID=1978227 RepID=UPI001A59D105|nr:vWA domain-containing protein [Steroidobacter sp.]MBL8265243.1 VWA domain-containing protein [Steroidobacter sp.]